MGSGFSDDRFDRDGAPGTAPAEGNDPSPAMQRFQTCRWRKASEEGVPEHCSHRDVVSIAGTNGFAAEAWCSDCAYYKAKRAPRKRPESPPDHGGTNWRW